MQPKERLECASYLLTLDSCVCAAARADASDVKRMWWARGGGGGGGGRGGEGDFILEVTKKKKKRLSKSHAVHLKKQKNTPEQA